FIATIVQKRNAIQNSPPTMRRDSSAVGENEKLKISTTSPAKNSMELKTSRDRHSRRRSFARFAAVSSANDARSGKVLMRSASGLRQRNGAQVRGQPAVRPKAPGVHLRSLREVPVDA